MEPQTSPETSQPSALQRFAPIIALGILLVVIVASTITLTSRSSDNVDPAADTIRLSAPATTLATSSSAAPSTSRSANPETEPAAPSDDATNQNRGTAAPEPAAPAQQAPAYQAPAPQAPAYQAPAQQAPVQQAPAPAAPPLNYQTWDDDDDDWDDDDDYDDDWDDDGDDD